jgi:hypothetical protein
MKIRIEDKDLKINVEGSKEEIKKFLEDFFSNTSIPMMIPFRYPIYPITYPYVVYTTGSGEFPRDNTSTVTLVTSN